METIRSKTGLVIDPYFSATKIRWILENIPGAWEAADRGELPHDKKLILFSMHGSRSNTLAAALAAQDYDAYSLDGGYEAWLRRYCSGEERALEIERSITKRRRFKENIFGSFTKAIVEFDMIQPGD